MNALERAKELPEDVITEILVSLPVRSLMRFKCVCKNWYDLITNTPSFINTHYATNKHNKNVTFYYHSPSFDDEYNTTFSFRIFDSGVDLTIPGTAMYLKTMDLKSIVGCSRGVVCLYFLALHTNKSLFIVWNPATREFKRISCLDDPANKWLRAGFCFDHVENTFQVLGMNIYLGKEGIVARVSTFPMKANCWRERTFHLTHLVFTDCDATSSYTVCTNRWLYIPIRKSGWDSDNRHILCFDMIDQVFECVESPCPGPTHSRLAQYKGTVALIARSDFDCCLFSYSFSVWVMDNSGSASPSWSKLVTCRPQGWHIQLSLGFFNNADGVNLVVLKGDYGLHKWLCDLKTGVLIKNFGVCLGHFVQYSESLAPIN